MINLIVVTHGEFGAYIMEAAEQIVGRQEVGVRVITISARVGVSEIRERICRAITALGPAEGLIIFTDISGGTPSNLAFPLIQDMPRVEIIAGLNLYMLISALTHRGHCNLEELVEKIIADGRKSICNLRREFMARAREGNLCR